MITAKVAISLPEAVLKAVEEARKTTGESRSGYFRRAVVELLKLEVEKTRASQYIEGYRQMPETETEIRQVHAISGPALSGENW
jgi:metal-responsive CopG/Arc/MetJ family transcriptional regulator